MKIVLDIETFKIKNKKLKMGLGYPKILIGIYNGYTFQTFKTFDKFLNYLFFTDCLKMYVYAHNGGKYDYMYLINEIIKVKKYQICNIKIINSSLLFDVKYKNKIIHFRDSFLLLPSSLKKLCISFKCKFNKIEMDYKKYYEYNLIVEYLKYDCLSLYELLNKFEEEIKNILNNNDFNINNHLTLAGLSFKILHKNFLKKQTLNFFKKEDEDFIRQGYYGGRTELYKMKGKNLFYYDVNSLYPFVMRNNNFPIGKFYIINNKKVIEHYYKSDLLGIIECELIQPYNHINLLPVKKDKKLIFPYGKIKGIYTTVELKVSGCKIIKFKKAIFWNNKKKIFIDFVDKFYKLKSENKGAKKQIGKLILNSSYGKFAQKRLKKIIKSELEISKEFNKIKEYEILGNNLFFTKDILDYSNRKINPIYAVFITAYARVEMYKYMKKIGFENIYYTDTDSIFTDKPLPEKLIHPSKIGFMSLENKVKKAVFLSPKLYSYIDIDNNIHTSARGVNKEMQDKLDLFNFKSYNYKTNNFMSFLTKFKRLNTKYNDNFINMENKKKEVKINFDKREFINEDHSKPLFINLW